MQTANDITGRPNPIVMRATRIARTARKAKSSASAFQTDMYRDTDGESADAEGQLM